MPDIVLNHIHLLEQFSYLGVFVAVALAGHFVPVPEDISLIAAGYIAALGYAKLWPMLLIGMTAPVFADLLLFYLSRIGSRFAPDPEKYADTWIFKLAKHHMHHNTILTVVLMRFVTGFRFMSPIVGAYIRVPVKKYLIANAISAALYGPFFILLGYKLHAQITFLINTLQSIEYVALTVIVVAVIIIAVLFVKKGKRYNTVADAEK